MVPREFHDWWFDRRQANRFEVDRIPFSQLDEWRFAPGTGNLTHASGRFFSVEGLRVNAQDGGAWSQPVLNQPEIGILGILVQDFGGVPHALMQAKMEPGNINVLQLSPTLQATRSNYTCVHRGSKARYLEYFRQPRRGVILVDALQSEQGAWFWRKHNRNIVIKIAEDVPAHEDFRWLPLDRVRQLMQVDNLVNMDARSVLACLPPNGERPDAEPASGPFSAALRDSYDRNRPARHTMGEILSWLTEAKTRCEWTARPVPLAELPNWSRTDDEITDENGERFRIMAVRVRADNREVKSWTQPLLAPRGQGLAAFLTRAFDGVLHVLMCARPEAGLPELIELGPTVRLADSGARHGHGNGNGTAGADGQEPYADLAAAADPGRIRFDAVLSEEGGRFHHAQTRYQVIEVGADFPAQVPDDFIWVTVDQLLRLVRHGHYLNVEARSLLACLHGLR